jgi:protein O-mannosyl-transferase
MLGKEIQLQGFSRNKLILWIVIILTLVFIAYIPIFQNGFLKTWDDNRYVLENKYIQEFNPGSLIKMFTIFYDGHYHPLTLLSLAIDFKIGKLDPTTYHITNLVLHLFNVIIVFLFVYYLFKKKELLIPVVAGLLFGISTIQVESVAWISERKNLLYSLFFFSSLISYLKYIELNRKIFYILSIVLFLFSLLSKSMALSLAATLILIDLFYQRNIFDRKVIMEKIPYFLLAIVFGILAVFAQKSTWGDNLSQAHYSFFERIFFGGYAFILYVVKAIIPVSMSGYYPYPEQSWVTLLNFIYCLATAGIFGLSIYFFKRFQQLSFGILFFCINIFLLLKIFEVPAGDYLMADRYAYIPSVGIFVIVGVGLKRLMDKTQLLKKAGIMVLIVYSSFLLYQTFTRISVWKDDISFYSDVIEKYPNADVAYKNRGAIRKENQELEGAMFDFNKAIQLGKNDYKSFSNRGAVYMEMGDFQNAIADYQKALKYYPNHPQILADYGFALMRSGDLNGAMNAYDKSLSFKSFNPELYVNRGTVYYNLGNIHRAIQDYNVAIQQKPGYVNAFFNRGLSKIKMNDFNSAIEDFLVTIKLDSSHAEAWSNMGVSWSRQNDYDKAMECYSEAIRIKPSYFEAWLNRGIDKYYFGDYNGARTDLDQTIMLNPTVGAAYYFRALLAGKTGIGNACDDLQKAIELGFNQASLTWKSLCD